ncbi:alpha/beta hydrolase [Niveispirillum lacus]|uniref:Alpha/beta hydrolase n=1 Tax=Niveispirillum lacus TaxID=1981099 RepID=A0A255YZT5_9PROT|nr:alpha/beta fold hydrolase [Niveispirillum lacus]OYQ34194.1 alpha/beta hydrolase [Niveispirillum lacus]
MTPPTPHARQPLLLLPGLLCDRALWAHQIAQLSDIADIQVPDLTGHERIGDLADSVLDSAPARFALAGLSMGGYVAFEIMRRAPERVTRLCLVDTSARPDTAEQRQRREAMLKLARIGKFRGMSPRLLSTQVHPNHVAVPEIGGVVLAMTERVGRDAFCRQQAAILSRPDSRPDLGGIVVPTLVVVGADDAQTPPDRSQEIAAAIRGAQLHILPHCGHLAPLEQPVMVTARMREWLNRD